jgi:hypothetical protein
VTTVDQADVRDLSSVRRPRTGLRRAAVAISVVLVTVVVAGLVYVANYAPLARGGGILTGGRVVPDEGLIRPDRTLANVLGEEFRTVNPRPGDGLGIGFGLTNRGPFAVEIIGIGMPYSSNPLESAHVIIDVRAYRAPDPLAPTQWEPFKPFVLKPDQARDVAVIGRFPACAGGISPINHRGSVSWITAVPVRYRFLGVRHTQEVPLDFAVSVEGWPDCSP